MTYPTRPPFMASSLPASPYLPLPTINITSVVNQHFQTRALFNKKTQFTAYLISHGLLGFVDGSSIQLSPMICDPLGNPSFH